MDTLAEAVPAAAALHRQEAAQGRPPAQPDAAGPQPGQGRPDTPTAAAGNSAQHSNTAPAHVDYSDTAALLAAFRRTIHSAPPAMAPDGKPVSPQEIANAVRSRHRQYDFLALALRAERGEELTGPSSTSHDLNVIPQQLAHRWVRTDARDLRLLMEGSGGLLDDNRLLNIANMMEGTARRSPEYWSALQDAAPDLMQQVQARTGRLLHHVPAPSEAPQLAAFTASLQTDAAAPPSATVREVCDKLRGRHYQYDELALAARSDRGDHLTGPGATGDESGVLPAAAARLWARVDAHALQAMSAVADGGEADRIRIGNAVAVVRNTARRNPDYWAAMAAENAALLADRPAERDRVESRAQAAPATEARGDSAPPAPGHPEQAAGHVSDRAPAATHAAPLADAAAAPPGVDPPPPVQASGLAETQVLSPTPAAPAAAAPATGAPARPRGPQPGPAAEQPSAPLAASRNGIAPGRGSPTDTAPVIKRLLEDMSYRVQPDGSVLYQVQGKDAFVDHGDQLLMVGGADGDERAILGALLLAKEKYLGAFELTGDDAFQHRAIEVMVKYQLDVRLKDPAQDAQRRALAARPDLSARVQQYPAASAQHPVAPVNLLERIGALEQEPRLPPVQADAAAQQWQAAAPAGPEDPRPHGQAAMPGAAASQAAQPPVALAQPEEVDRLSGKLLRHGAAPYLHVKGNNASYFAELENADGRVHTQWGKALKDALAEARVQIGEQITLQSPEQKAVTVRRPILGPGGSVTGYEEVDAVRNAWLVSRPHARQNGHRDAQDTDRGAPSPQPDGPLQGRLLRHGPAPMKHAPDGRPSYFVDIEDDAGKVRSAWGLDLARAMQQSGAQPGDAVHLLNLGRKAMQIDAPLLDDSGNVVGLKKGVTHRNAWQVTRLEPTPTERAAEPPPAGQERLVPIGQAAWWDRQIAFTQHFVREAPELLQAVAQLGAKPEPDSVGWIGQSGDFKGTLRDAAHAACLAQPVQAAGNVPPEPLISGGALDSHPAIPALALASGGEGYLQGLALVGGQLRHVVALLPPVPPGQDGGFPLPVPLLAAAPGHDGLRWELVGHGQATPHDGTGSAPLLRFQIGDRACDAKLQVPGSHPLREQLGMPAASMPERQPHDMPADSKPAGAPAHAARPNVNRRAERCA